MNIRLNIGGVQPFTSSERRQGTVNLSPVISPKGGQRRKGVIPRGC